MLKAIITVDALEVGDTIDGIIPLKVTLGVDEIFTYPNSGKSGVGWAKYKNITIPENSKADFDFEVDGTMSITTSAGFGITENNANTVNIYKDGTDIKFKNKTGAVVVVTYYIMAA